MRVEGPPVAVVHADKPQHECGIIRFPEASVKLGHPHRQRLVPPPFRQSRALPSVPGQRVSPGFGEHLLTVPSQRIATGEIGLEAGIGFAGIAVNAERQAMVAATMGHPGEDAGDVLDAFIAGLGMPRSLGAVKIGAESFARMAEDAMNTPWVPRNPRPIAGSAQVREILELAA